MWIVKFNVSPDIIGDFGDECGQPKILACFGDTRYDAVGLMCTESEAKYRSLENLMPVGASQTWPRCSWNGQAAHSALPQTHLPYKMASATTTVNGQKMTISASLPSLSKSALWCLFRIVGAWPGVIIKQGRRSIWGFRKDDRIFSHVDTIHACHKRKVLTQQ